jgi:hypothetical protein
MVCVDPKHKLQEFENEWPEEGIEIFGLVRARNDTDTDHVLELEAYFRREVVVEHQEGPASLFPIPERRKTISRKTKGNVGIGIEEAVVLLLIANSDLHSTQHLVDLAIIDIANKVPVGLVLMSVAHPFDHIRITVERKKPCGKRDIVECFSRLSRRGVPSFLTESAVRVVLIRSSVRHAYCDAAIDVAGLELDEMLNERASGTQRGMMVVGEGLGKVRESGVVKVVR